MECQVSAGESAVSSTQGVPKWMDSAQNRFLSSSSLFMAQTSPRLFPILPSRGSRWDHLSPRPLSPASFACGFSYCNVANMRRGPDPQSEITRRTHLLSVNHTQRLVPLWYIPSIPFMTGIPSAPPLLHIGFWNDLSIQRKSSLKFSSFSSSCASN